MGLRRLLRAAMVSRLAYVAVIAVLMLGGCVYAQPYGYSPYYYGAPYYSSYPYYPYYYGGGAFFGFDFEDEDHHHFDHHGEDHHHFDDGNFDHSHHFFHSGPHPGGPCPMGCFTPHRRLR